MAPATNYSVLEDQLIQQLSPAKSEKVGTPLTFDTTTKNPRGVNYVLTTTDDGKLAITDSSQKQVDPFYKSLGQPTATITNALETRPIPNTDFVKLARWARFDERWVILRGDWGVINDKGIRVPEEKHRGGLFDRLTRKFIIRQKAVDDKNIKPSDDKIFYFGPSSIPLRPIVGDWDGDGVDTIGIEPPNQDIRYLKNSFEGGKADLILKEAEIKNLVIDGTSKWHKNAPSKKYILKYEGLKPNTDYAYDCQGIPLKTPESKDTNNCKDNFTANLVLWEYSNSDKKWPPQGHLIDKMWAGSQAGIDFLVFKNVLIVAYYNQYRQVTVAIRKDGQWHLKALDSKFKGWDSHNYLVLEVDENHDIHLSGNMHAMPLNYWHSNGLDIDTFKREKMVDNKTESEVTYPTFSRDPNGNLLFSYRQGYSGNGAWIYNQYDSRKKIWKRFLNTELFGK